MKKIKKSVKVLIFALIAVICVAAIVLGVVFGGKKNNGGNGSDSNPQTPVYGFTRAQQLLANEINDNAISMATNYEVIDGVPYNDYNITANDIVEMNTNYFIYQDGLKNYHFVAFDKNNGEYLTNEITSNKYDFVGGNLRKFYSFSNDSNYLVIASTPDNKLYTVNVVYYADINNPVSILKDESSNNYVIMPDSIVMYDSAICYLTYDGTVEETERTYTLHYYKLKNFTYEDYELNKPENTIEGIESIAGNSFLLSNSFVYTLTGSKLTILSFSNGEIFKNEIMIDNSKGSVSFVELSKNKLLVSYSKVVSTNISTTTVYEQDKYVDYNYEIITISNSGLTRRDFALSDGYSKIQTFSNYDTCLTDSFVVAEQKVDDDNFLTEKYKITYYDRDFNIIVSFTSNYKERILRAGESVFITTARVMPIGFAGEIDSEKVIDLSSEGTYSIYLPNTIISTSVFSIIKDGSFGLMNLNGEILSNPDDQSFQLYTASDNCAIGVLIERDQDGNLKDEKSYGLFNFSEKTFNKIEIADDYEFLQLLVNGFSGYFEYKKDSGTYNFLSLDGTLLADEIDKDALEFVDTNNGSILSFGNKCVRVDSTGINFNFKQKVATIDNYDGFIDNYASVSYSGGTITFNGSVGCYITSATITYSYVQAYTANITNGSKTSFSFSAKGSGWAWHDKSGTGSVSLNSSYYYVGNFTVDSGFSNTAISSVSETAVTYTTYFYYNYDSSYYSRSDTLGHSYSVISTSRAGYIFNGWYTASSGGSRVTSYICTGTRYLYAQWSAITYNISYTLNSGSYGTYAPTSVTYDSSFQVSNPTRTGYTFSSWTISGMSSGITKYHGTSSSASTTLAASSTTSATSKYTYFKNLCSTSGGTVYFSANWTANTYYISYTWNSGSSGTYAPTSATYDSSFQVSNPTRTGYTFSSWTVSGMTNGITKYYGTSSSTSSSIASSTTSTSISSSYTYFRNLNSSSGGTVYFSANWTANTYYISYTWNSGSSSSYATSATYGSSFYVANPTRTGYTFSSWTISGMSSGITKYHGTTSTASSTLAASSTTSTTSSYTYFKNLCSTNGGTVYFSANWTANTYYISYTWNSGSSSSYVTSATYDSSFYVANPTRTGYTFSSWTISGMSSGITKYHGTTSSTTTSIASSTTSTTSSYTYFKNLTSTSGGTVYFSANFTANTYYISYSLNSGSSGTYAPTSATYDTVFQVSNPTRTGYTFSSWTISGMTNGITKYYGTSSSTTSSIASSTTSTSISSSYTYFKNLNSISGGTVYFSANWTANTYYISYTWNSGSSSSYATSAKYDSSFYVANPTRTGYTFSSWTISGMSSGITKYHGTSSSASSTLAASSTTSATSTYTYFKNLCSTSGGTVYFTANFTANKYNITYNFNGGSAGGGSFPSTATYDTSFNVSNPGTAPTGYHFYSWTISGMSSGITKYYGTSSSTTSSIGSSTTSTTISSSYTYFKNLNSTSGGTVTFTANWEANRYNITYTLTDSKGGDGHFTGSYPTYGDYNSWVQFVEPVRTGYTFVGWSFTNLSDDCTHYYNSSTSGSGTSFASSGGRYVNPESPSDLQIISKSYLYFMNLHLVQGATINAVANWAPNTYTITYHFIPSSFRAESARETDLANSANMTATKTQTVTYDALFTLFRSSLNSSDALGVELPADLVLAGWAFYQNAGTYTVATYSGGNPTPLSSICYGAGTQTIYNFYGSNCHAYAYYSFADLSIEFYGISNANDINDVSKYTKLNEGSVRTYSAIDLPSSIGGFNVLGYMISSNRLDAGILNKGSISEMNVGGTKYVVYAGSTVLWGYSSTLAYDLDKPTFYLYAIYEIDSYTVNYTAEAPSASSYLPTGYIEYNTIPNGSSIALPSSGFTLTGYNLMGWRFEGRDMFGSEWYTLGVGDVFNPSTYSKLSTKTITMYAVWTPISYTISYEFNGGSGISGGTFPTSATFDSWFTVSVPVRTGYILTEYYVTNLTTYQMKYYGSSQTTYSTTNSLNNTLSRTSASGVSADYWYKNLRSEAGNIVFVAVWTPITYTISYSNYDGSTTSQEVKYGEVFALNYPNNRVGYTLSTFSISGMDSSNHSYSTSSSFASQTNFTTSSTTGSTSTTYYWKNLTSVNGATVRVSYSWNVNTYTVSHEYYSGSSSTTTYNYGTWYTISAPTRAGYTFTSYSIVGMDEYAHNFGTSTSSYETVYGSTYAKDKSYSYFRNLRADSTVTVIIRYDWSISTYSVQYANETQSDMIANYSDTCFDDKNQIVYMSKKSYV